MSPIAAYDTSPGPATAKTRLIKEPLRYSGSLKDYRRVEHTQAIGTEFPDLQLADILDDDVKIRDLAILASQRGVVFFRHQDLTIDQHKLLATKLGELSGKPKTSKLHKHPVLNSSLPIAVDETGRLDNEVSVLSSTAMAEHYPHLYQTEVPLRPLASHQWHFDISFEAVPSDYGVLQMLELPEDGTGGDTLFASAYEVYDRLSPPMKQMIDGLTASYLVDSAEKTGTFHEDRGAPENNSRDLTTIHPAVRTNPVTGWKSLWAVGKGRGTIQGVTNYEEQMFQRYFLDLLVHNHDLQVRFRWNPKDLVIWDNRSVIHAATNDYTGYRRGNRVLSLGESPYLDPASKSRRETLASEDV